MADMSASSLTRVRTRLSSAVPVVVGLAAGFGIAQGTGVRALGGVVFAAGGLVAGWLWHQRRGLAVALALGVVYVAAFVLALVLAIGVGLNAWLSVALVTAVAAAVSVLVGDRPRADRAG
jgi:peptidoglycan/LPS O-acetylase OafA/YrhL